MTHISFRRLAFSCAAVFLAGAMTPAFAEDRELQEATGFTGTIMYLSAKVPGLIFGAVRNGETALVGFGETRDGSGKEPDENSIFRIASVSKVFCGNVLGSLVVGRGAVLAVVPGLSEELGELGVEPALVVIADLRGNLALTKDLGEDGGAVLGGQQPG